MTISYSGVTDTFAPEGHRIIQATVNLDSAYTASGYSITATGLGLTAANSLILGAFELTGTDGRTYTYNPATQKLIAWDTLPAVRLRTAAGGAAGNITVTGVAATDILGGVAVFVTGSVANSHQLTASGGLWSLYTGITGTTGNVPGFGVFNSGYTLTAANTINNTGGVSTAGFGLLVLTVGHNPPTEVVAGTDLSAVAVTGFFIVRK